MPEEYLYKVVDAIDEVAKETGKTVPQIALNWLLRRPTVSTLIVGARNEEQLKQNLGAIGWELTKEQIAKLDAASEVPLTYPYWHQRQFDERNPKPVSRLQRQRARRHACGLYFCEVMGIQLELHKDRAGDPVLAVAKIRTPAGHKRAWCASVSSRRSDASRSG